MSDGRVSSQARLSQRKTSSQSRASSTRQASSHSKVSSGARSTSASKSVSAATISEYDPRFPRVRNMAEVIDHFFNQIVQFAIEDMVLLELTEEENIETQISSTVIKDYRELQPEDFVDMEVTASSGSRITLTKRVDSGTRRTRKSFPSSLGVIKEEPSGISRGFSTATSASSGICLDAERQVRITFTNGNVYEGTIAKRIMNGPGKYIWEDGTIYEGEFKDGFPTGKGQMTLPDLSHYAGGFNQGLFHGEGFLNIVSTPSFYSGEWKNGKKDGKGWLLYEPGDWYEGGWKSDLKHGFGVRNYKNGAKYRGTWRRGVHDGFGVMIWENHDYYKGEWCCGNRNGEGEYIWNAFYNNAFAFPVQNVYRGWWERGKRSGLGIMNFGDDTGLKLLGTWQKDFKHGIGYLICGNGKLVQRDSLFLFDKLVDPDMSLWSLKGGKNYRKSQELPIFRGPEYVQVGYYVGKVLSKLTDVSLEKLKMVKSFEKKHIRYVIIRFLPQLKELYQEYATLGAKVGLGYEPVLVRLFLWQLYKDKEIYKCGLSLADCDSILALNPQSCVDSVHGPFEPIYFWQFLMSLIGVALSDTCLESLENIDTPTTQGVIAGIIRTFLETVIFAKPPDNHNHNQRAPLILTYLDLAPIKSIYSLYKQIGEPHSARTFLMESCPKRGETPVLCHLEFLKQSRLRFGTNLVPLHHHIEFENESTNMEELPLELSSLYVFGVLGPKNIVRCLSQSCHLIKDDNLVVNIDYPIVFLEFYETVLACIFMVLELQLKKEEEELLPPEQLALRKQAEEKKMDKGDTSGATKKKAKKKKK